MMDVLTNSPIVSSGLLLMASGSVMALCRNIPAKTWHWFLRQITVNIEIKETDESYAWMQMWLAKEMPRMRRMSVLTKQNKQEKIDYSQPIDNRPKILFSPSDGTHFMWYSGRPVFVTRYRQNNSSSGGGGGGLATALTSLGKQESFSIRILGRDSSLADKIMKEARDLALPQDGRIDVRVANINWSGYWLLADRIRPRPIDSIILPNDRHLDVLKDIKTFLNSYDWYARLGIPFRRGYLLYGDPGGGKTSLAVAIASNLKMNIYVLNLSAGGMSDNKLNELLISVSDNSIILMEDIDCAFVKREKKDKEEEGLTFSGLLNALDGVSGKDGRVIIMTTNHIDQLDPALIRPGRIDYRCQIRNAEPKQAKKLFDRFFPDAPKHLSGRFECIFPNGTVSMAALQGHLVKYKDSPENAVNNICEISKSDYKEELAA